MQQPRHGRCVAGSSDGCGQVGTERDQAGEVVQVVGHGEGVYGVTDDGRLLEVSADTGGACVEVVAPREGRRVVCAGWARRLGKRRLFFLDDEEECSSSTTTTDARRDDVGVSGGAKPPQASRGVYGAAAPRSKLTNKRKSWPAFSLGPQTK